MIPLDPLRRPLPCSLQDNVATIRLTQPSVAHRIESFDVVALSEVFDRIESDSIATRAPVSEAMTSKRIRALSMKAPAAIFQTIGSEMAVLVFRVEWAQAKRPSGTKT